MSDFLKKAIESGTAGYKAMIIQVFSLMWLRTIMNYQYKNGTSIPETVSILFKQGGFRRFYAGILPALIQGPLSRFTDTFTNSYALSYLRKSKFPIWVQTSAASIAAGVMRLLLTPIDTLKTISQVQGQGALYTLYEKILVSGFGVLYHGAVANMCATIMGHFPWFVTHNYLNHYLPQGSTRKKNLIRNALIGFTSSLVSDTVSNSMRVIKTFRQTNATVISYPAIVAAILAKDGINGLLFRGLGTRLLTNGLQGMLFNVLWKFFDNRAREAKK